jgi:hypothetical protein
MESTGCYWKPVFNLLEDSVAVSLTNGQDVKGRKGHKTAGGSPIYSGMAPQRLSSCQQWEPRSTELNLLNNSGMTEAMLRMPVPVSAVKRTCDGSYQSPLSLEAPGPGDSRAASFACGYIVNAVLIDITARLH